jgi:endo-1,3(4)-beta-glucanase
LTHRRFVSKYLQESSSEAVNSYYSIYLLGAARGDNALADWGRLLLAMELRAARKYWHIKPTGPQIYPKPFAANGVVGVLWSTQVGLAAHGSR